VMLISKRMLIILKISNLLDNKDQRNLLPS
jgi:hypothetical protein